MKRIVIAFPASMVDELDAISAKTGRARVDIIRAFVAHGVAEETKRLGLCLVPAEGA